jgi:RNA polymerase sporulation-specific sigma factor
MNNFDLIILAKNGSQEAINRIFEENKNLVYSLINKYYIDPSDFDDVVQEAYNGLFLAIKRFDISYNVNFSTYAYYLILGEIKKYFRNQNRIHISRSKKDLLRKVKNAIKELSLNGNYHPSINDISEFLGENKEDIIEIFSLDQMIYSFDEVTTDDLSLYDFVPSENFDQESLNLKLILEVLPKMEKLIIELRYFYGLTQQEIAYRLKMNQVQVSRIEQKILLKLKQYLV